MDDRELLLWQTGIERRVDNLQARLVTETALINQELRQLPAQIAARVTHIEFQPYKIFTAGLAAGVLTAALAAVMSRILGW